MSTIQLPGLTTGIDTSQLISQLMAVESRTLNLYTARQKTWDQKKDTLSTLESKLSNLKSSISALSNADELRTFSATSSDSDIITAEASYNAFEGNHSVVVNQLATTERWVHSTGMKYTEDYVGSGTFIYSYNNKETALTTTDTTTLDELVGMINNDANNPGVTASLLYYNNAYHLVLNGNDAGSDYRISVNSSSSQVLETESELTTKGDNATMSTKIVDLDQFGDSFLEGGETIQITGTDHNGNSIQPVTISVTRNTKLSQLVDEINDAFDGVAKATLENGKIVLTDKASGESGLSLNLTYNANGSPATLSLPSMSVKTQGGGIDASLANFAASNFTQTQAAQNSLIKVDGFPSGSGTCEVQTMSRSTSPDSGTYTLTYEGQTTAPIAYNASVEDIQAALEALSTVNPGDITVDGSSNGLADGDITFTFSDNLGDVSMISVNSSNLSPAGSPATVTETTKGIPTYISRSSNTIDDVIQGVTLHLHDTTDASGEQINLTRDIDSVKTKLNAMVDAYNLAVSYIKDNSSYDENTKVAGILMGDYTVTSIKSDIRTPIIAQTNGFIADLDSFLMPGQIGLELDKDGFLSLDENAFDTAIAKNYMSVLSLIGANKTGSSNSNTIEYYGASSKYTSAGSYDVQVTVSGGVITSAKIKLAGETAYRNATVSGNIIIGESSFDNNGDPVRPENGLQLSIDLGHDGTFNASVQIKQGFTGAMADTLDKILKTSSGTIKIDEEHIKEQIDSLQDRMDQEQYRLDKKQEDLNARFARLEKTLTLLQNQMSGLGLS